MPLLDTKFKCLRKNAVNTYPIFEEKTERQMDCDFAWILAHLWLELQNCFDDINWSHIERWESWCLELLCLSRLLARFDFLDPPSLILVVFLTSLPFLLRLFLLSFYLFLKSLSSYWRFCRLHLLYFLLKYVLWNRCNLSFAFDDFFAIINLFERFQFFSNSLKNFRAVVAGWICVGAFYHNLLI